ncbi:hypothetical protein Ahy_A07g036979 [Arachis hypogaea]|uniref:Nucleosome assembly protein n=1 Tax=Arachis hypogaea TaxID=3818 RepID=A0A445CHI7_ARAHY|nr:hypothetical protein Ahy_A07g036979 [Arachis hypogaea]
MLDKRTELHVFIFLGFSPAHFQRTSLILNSKTQTLFSLSLPLESLSVSLGSLLVHTHRRLVAPLVSSPAFQRLAAFPGLLLTGDRSNSSDRCRSSIHRRESPWIVDCLRVVTCFVAHPLLGSGPLHHLVVVALGNVVWQGHQIHLKIGQHDELEVKFSEERASLEAKYQKMYQPLYTKRFEIVNGVIEVEGITEEKTADAEEDEEKGVPVFWLNAMKNNEVLAEEISEHDEGALKFLNGAG